MYRNAIFSIACAIAAAAAPLAGNGYDFITYEWLIDCAVNTNYTDHIPHFRRLFNSYGVRGFLECGCGFSTKYFLDRCDRVVSVEFLNPGTDRAWLDKCEEMYAGISNWVPLAYNADLQDVSFNNACGYQCATHRDYALIDSSYLITLNRYFKRQIIAARKAGSPIDAAFVDAGVYIRGDMVKLLLANNVPVVAAHDTASDEGTDVEECLYGWNKVYTPPDYEKIYIPFGVGTTFWISKTLPQVIAALTAYRDAIAAAGENIDFDMLTTLADAP